MPQRVVQPLQAFLDQEVSSGVLLIGATIVALVWANSPWDASYDQVWSTRLSLRIGTWAIGEDARHWVNDGLMSLFFLVVGLEVKREILTGELRDPRAAAVPVVAAVGGMVVPALLYLAVNAGGEGARGWGVPMATDIAFAVGVLTIAARAAPPGLKPFLLTLAIVDDIGAIVVIALFYSEAIEWPAVGAGAALCLVVVALRRIHVRAGVVYVALGVAVWLAAYRSGVHPTIAGVVLGLLTPAAPFQRPRAVSGEAHRVADLTVDEPDPPDADAHHWLGLASLSREAVSPLARVEHLLHPWTSNLVIPLFALANAGIRVSGDLVADAATSPVTIGIVVGLVVGKAVGVTLASLAAVRMGIGRLPEGVGARHVLGVGVVAGIGFTVSIFVADLAFAGAAADLAKVGVLLGSLVAGMAGVVVLTARSRRA